MRSFKSSFVLHDDSLEILDDLSDEECGKLFKTIAKVHKLINEDKTEWVNSDSLGLSRLEWITFKPFYNQLLRDLELYKTKCSINLENGLKGGRPKKKPTGFLNNPKNPDSDSDSDSVTDKEKIINERFEKIWIYYDIKSAKGLKSKALSAYKKHKLNKVSSEDIMKVLDFEKNKTYGQRHLVTVFNNFYEILESCNETNLKEIEQFEMPSNGLMASSVFDKLSDTQKKIFKDNGGIVL